MKVKLLKKVRKRFKIVHYPDGILGCDNTHYKYNLYRLEDNEDREGWYTRYAQLGKRPDGKKYVDEIFETEKECIEYLKKVIIVRLTREGHKNRRMKQMPLKNKQVWP